MKLVFKALDIQASDSDIELVIKEMDTNSIIIIIIKYLQYRKSYANNPMG